MSEPFYGIKPGSVRQDNTGLSNHEVILDSRTMNCPHCDKALELVGRKEAAERLGVSVDVLDSWRNPKAHQLPVEPPFPGPAVKISGYSPLWVWETIKEWREERVRQLYEKLEQLSADEPPRT